MRRSMMSSAQIKCIVVSTFILFERATLTLCHYLLLQLKNFKTQIEDTTLQYPDYYHERFHAYDGGNLDWEATWEFEVAAATTAMRIFKDDNITSDAASHALRRSFLDATEVGLCLYILYFLLSCIVPLADPNCSSAHMTMCSRSDHSTNQIAALPTESCKKANASCSQVPTNQNTFYQQVLVHQQGSQVSHSACCCHLPWVVWHGHILTVTILLPLEALQCSWLQPSFVVAASHTMSSHTFCCFRITVCNKV